MQIRGIACSGTLPRLSGCGAVGSVLPWGGRGRRFKSGHSDQRNPTQFRGLFGIAWGFLFSKKQSDEKLTKKVHNKKLPYQTIMIGHFAVQMKWQLCDLQQNFPTGTNYNMLCKGILSVRICCCWIIRKNIHRDGLS